MQLSLYYEYMYLRKNHLTHSKFHHHKPNFLNNLPNLQLIRRIFLFVCKNLKRIVSQNFELPMWGGIVSSRLQDWRLRILRLKVNRNDSSLRTDRSCIIQPHFAHIEQTNRRTPSLCTLTTTCTSILTLTSHVLTTTSRVLSLSSPLLLYTLMLRQAFEFCMSATQYWCMCP